MLNSKQEKKFQEMVKEGVELMEQEKIAKAFIEAEDTAGQLFCRECNENKEQNMFYKNKSLTRGFSYSCKKCDNKRRNFFRKTFDGLISDIYYQQKRNSEKRNHIEPTYTKEELYEFLAGNETFNKMFQDWEKSNYNLMLRPTCDRFNDYAGYSFENIEPKTYRDNIEKASRDRRNGINNKVSKTVIKLDENENEICRYPSIQFCSREENISVDEIKRNKKWKIIQ